MKGILKRATALGLVTTVVVGFIALAAIGAGGIVAWEYSNSDQFCATMCHSVHPEETRMHLVSSHSRVECVECHIGRISTLKMISLKPQHAKELWGMIVGYERPLYANTLLPVRENCEGCHWPSAEHHDSLAVKKRYATDADSSETTYRLTLHTGFGVIRDKQAKGIHWHIENDVSFIALDPQRRQIPWVQVKAKDGTTTTYVDAKSPVSAEELKKLKPRRMACYDCHNAVGHPFANPIDQVDEALALGKIDRSLPSAKARAVALVDEALKLSGTPEQLAPKFDKLIADSVPKGDIKDDMREPEKKFAAEMKKILLQTSFTRDGLSWKSFPNHAAHKDFPGCFRCHDGKHLSDKGESIRLQCTLCHELPRVERENGEGSVASTVMAGLTPPDSHNEPNFMHDHRTRLDASCTMCHGKKLEFGREGGNFCSNPACHGRKWPEVTLSVKAPN